MALLSIIRRWHLREEIPIREIERRTGLSRNTIRKYLRSGAVEPKFKVPDRPSNLDPFADRLEAWLRVAVGTTHLASKTDRLDYIFISTEYRFASLFRMVRHLRTKPLTFALAHFWSCHPDTTNRVPTRPVDMCGLSGHLVAS